MSNDKKLLKEKAFSVVYPNEAFDDAKIRQSMYFLMKALEDYLLYKNMKEEETKNAVALANIYRKRKLEKLWNKTIKAAKIDCLKQPYRDSDFHQKMYLISREEYEFAEIQKRTDAQKKLKDLTESFSKYYLSEEVILFCMNLSIPKTEDYEVFTKASLKYIENSDFNNSPSIDIYYCIYKVFTENDFSTFSSLKNKLIDYKKNFQKDELREIYLITINYCIRQMNMGNKKFLREAFDLYKSGIEDSLLMKNRIIDRFLFRNIVSAGVLLKEFVWVENFIKNNQKFLDDEHRENYTTFCLADLYYHRKDYKKAMQFLAAYEYDDILLNLNSRVKLIKMYYELEEANALEALIESSKIYIRRKKGIAENYRVAYNNIIKYTQKLLRVNPYDKEKKAKLREEIQAANPLIEKQWFLERLEQL
ncbi:MAG: hypothetical protein AAFP82_00615 [Bacteroidota bacterium]